MKKSELIEKFKPLHEKYGEALADFDFAWSIRGSFMQEVGSAKEMRDEIIALGFDAIIAAGNVVQAQDALLEAHGVSLRVRNREMFTKAADRLRSAFLLGKQWCAANMFQYEICAAQFRHAVNQMLESNEDIRVVQDAELEKLCEEGGAQ